MLLRDRYRRLKIRLLSWEYWPLWLANLPVVIIYLFYAIRSRSWMFFANANPAIPTGGLFGESKAQINRLLPEELIAPSFLVDPRVHHLGDLERWMSERALDYPIVCKPDVGERGRNVRIIGSASELEDYLLRTKEHFLLQEYIRADKEYSVLAYVMPQGRTAAITSICYKIPLQIIGDGQSSMEELIRDHPRSFLQLERLKTKWGAYFDDIPLSDQVIILEQKGNHCLGAHFTDANHLINDKLTAFFVDILSKMDGVYIGRFDLKCPNEEDFVQARQIRVVEFNGVGGEPAHMYDHKYNFLDMISIMKNHWKLIYTIARIQRQAGHQAPSILDGIRAFIAYRKKLNL